MSHIHWYQVLLLIICVGAWLYHRKQTAPAREAAKKAATPDPDKAIRDAVEKVIKQEPPEVVFANLRKEAFLTTPDHAPTAEGGGEGAPYGAVMEMGISNSIVTLAAFADGDAKVFYQTGGGMIGGIAHETTRNAAKAFVAATGKALSRLARTTGLPPLPGPDRVRFSALTPRGLYSTEVGREDLGDKSDPLSALFYSGQEVVAQMRQVQSKKS
jgi:hypothetical protein